MARQPISTLFVVCALAAGRAATAGAQTPASSTPQLPVIKEQIEVVATRLPETPHDVPVSIEVIDGDTLNAIGATTLGEALSLAAGVDIAPGSDSGPAGAVPEFWGLREFDAFLLVVDGIPWGGAFNPDLTTLYMRDVERVEILRGPAPVTFGATSFVGVIHVVHKAAAAERSYLSAHGGSFASGSGAVDLALPAFGTWKSRLSADVDRKGFRDGRTSFARGHANYRGASSASGRNMWLFTDLNWLAQDPASPHVRQGATLSSLTPLDANYNPAGAYLDNTRFAAAWGIDRAVLRDARWSVTASYSHSGHSMFRGFLTEVANTPGNATGFRETIDINDIYADSHVTWPLGPNVQLIAGGDYLFGNGEGKGATFTYTAPLAATSAPAVPEPTTLDLDSESRRQFFGGYVSTEWTPQPRLHVSAGVRLNATVERRGEGESTSHARPAGSVGAIWTLWQQGVNHVKLFGNYRDTFKPAAFDFSLAENEGVLLPETARSFDGGIKGRAAQGRLDYEVSVFRMDFQNLVTATVVGGLPSLQNSGSTRFQGVEVAADVRGAHNLSGRMSYSYHDSTFVDFVQAFDGVNTQLAGNRFEMSARHLFSSGVILAPATGVTGDVLAKYVGDRFLNKRNTALAGGFATVDAGVGYRLDRYELRLDGRNLGDRRDPASESELGDAQYYRMNARRFDVTFGLRF